MRGDMYRWLGTLFIAGCTADPTTLVPGDVTAVGTASPFVDAVLNVAVDGPAGEAFVEYGLDDFSLATPPSPSATHHDLAVLGLKASHTYQWRAVVVDGAGVRHESEIGTFEVPAPPPKLFPVSVATDDPSAEMRFFVANVVRTNDGIAFAAILDRDGDWVWWVDSGGRLITSPKLSLDGRSILWNEYDFRQQDVLGKIVRVSLDGRARTDTNSAFAHHDFAEMDDGTFAFLNMVFDDFEFAGETTTIAGDEISTIAEGGTGPVPVFSMFDDFPLEPVLTCTHMKPASGAEEFFGTEAYPWTHSNSLMYLPDTDSYYVLQKYTDWLIRIDRSTGAVDWFMNGRESEFTDPDGASVWNSATETQLWSHGHMSEIWDHGGGGGGLLFDNGDHADPELSRAVEFAYDEGERTVEIVWEFPHPGGEHTAVMGDVRMLPQDHRLVTWSELGSVTEVTADGDIVWEAEWTRGPPLDAIIGRVVPFADLYAPRAGVR